MSTPADPYRFSSREIREPQFSSIERLFMSGSKWKRALAYLLLIGEDALAVLARFLKKIKESIIASIIFFGVASATLIVFFNFLGQRFLGVEKVGSTLFNVGMLLWVLFNTIKMLKSLLDDYLSRYKDKISKQIEAKLNEKGLLPPKLDDPSLSYSQSSHQESYQESQK